MYRGSFAILLLLCLLTSLISPALAEEGQVLVIATENNAAAFAIHVNLDTYTQQLVLTHLDGGQDLQGQTAADVYHSGGAEALAQALMFDLPSAHTIELRLSNIEKIVDLLDGVPLRLTPEESLLYNLSPEPSPRTVDGAIFTDFLRKALSGTADQRQRARIAAMTLLEQLLQLPLDQMLLLLPQAFESIQTTMPLHAMASLAKDASALRDASVIIQSYSQIP